jgi:hypothetical protein
MRSWINYWIIIPIRFAIRKRISLYQVYSEVWDINNIFIGRYRHRYDPSYIYDTNRKRYIKRKDK